VTPPAPSFDDFYRQRWAWAVRLTYGIVGDRAVAEELAQDVFVRVASRYAMLGEPVAYLRTALVNRARSHLRRRVLERRNEQRAPDPSTPSHLVEFVDALNALSPRQRIAVVLRHVEGLDDEAIAELLDCRQATVRSLVHRGLAALREVLPND